MARFPTNRIADLACDGNGITLDRMPSATAHRDGIEQRHKDDYYIFGLLRSGRVHLNIDFEDMTVEGPALLCLQPGQVHSFGGSDDAEGLGIAVDPVLVGERYRSIFDEHYFRPSPLPVDPAREEELTGIFEMIGRRRADPSAAAREVVRDLTRASVGIVAEAIEAGGARFGGAGRHMRIMRGFDDLLKEEICRNRKVSYYAGRLNISPSYLNEAVKAVTGTSASRYIQNRIILKIKMSLAYTAMSIQQAAADGGFDDCAYFSRLFAKVCGETPSQFRRRYRE